MDIIVWAVHCDHPMDVFLWFLQHMDGSGWTLSRPGQGCEQKAFGTAIKTIKQTIRLPNSRYCKCERQMENQ